MTTQSWSNLTSTACIETRHCEALSQNIYVQSQQCSTARFALLRSSWDAKEKILALPILHLPSKDAELLLFYRSNFDAESFWTFFTNRRVSLFCKSSIEKKEDFQFPGIKLSTENYQIEIFCIKIKNPSGRFNFWNLESWLKVKIWADDSSCTN